MKTSQRFWNAIQPIYQSILDHPFNVELAEGTLDLKKFQFYLKQDALYLVDFSKALALAGTKTTNESDLDLFLKFAEGALIAERSLHEYYFEQFQIEHETEESPACFTYTRFLIATASQGSLSEAMGALLPCFWIYREVGSHIHKHSKSNNPFQKWINTYSGEEFHQVVEDAINVTDRIAETVGPHQVDVMEQAFIKSTRLEWMFWDSAYRMETWKP